MLILGNICEREDENDYENRILSGLSYVICHYLVKNSGIKTL